MLPTELQSFDSWVVWKAKNAPRSPITGKLKNWNENAGSYAQAVLYCESNPGYRLGFLFSPDNDVFGIDLDSCRDPSTGVVDDWATEIIERVGSYAEVSASGTGVKIIGTSTTGREGRRACRVVDGTSHGDHEPHFEIYDVSKYFALTGEVLDGFEAVVGHDLATLSRWFTDRVDYIGDLAPMGEDVKPADVATTFEGPRTYQDVFNDEHSVASILLAAGWSQTEDGFRRPGKDSDGVSGTVRRDENGRERFSNWSTSVVELVASDPGGRATTYDAWSLNAHLHYGGDFGKAKRDWLRSRPDLDDRPSPSDDFSPIVKSSTGVEVKPIKALPKAIDDAINRPFVRVSSIVADGPPELRPAIVDGLFREGETVNLIAASKTGKSFLVHDLAYTIAGGGKWLDTFDVPKARPVAIFDNELHEETLRWRLANVAKDRGTAFEFGADPPVYFKAFRGGIPNIWQLQRQFEQFEPDQFGAIIFDAFYRFIPAGVSESDNGEMTQIYNAIDQMALRLRTAIVLVHHTSKGDQSGKSRVDVGSGAGAMARAADCHLVIREHEEEGLSVLEADTRSFKRPGAMSIELDGLRWKRADAAAQLRKPGPRKDTSKDSADIASVVEWLRSNGSATSYRIFKAGGLKIGRGRLDRLLNEATAAGTLDTEEKVGERGLFYKVADVSEFL